MITRITLSGFKSIEQMTLDLKPLNVLIGANGAGKSNLISLLDMLRKIGAESLQHFVGREGGANSLLFCGAKNTPALRVCVEYESGRGDWEYCVELEHAASDTLIFRDEQFAHRLHSDQPWQRERLYEGRAGGHQETRLYASEAQGRNDMGKLLQSCRVYHFGDTCPTAPIRQTAAISDSVRLRGDGANLAVVLRSLLDRHDDYYTRIIQTIRSIAPWFHDFCLEPLDANQRTISLNWRGADPETQFGPHQLPDGGLRAMALITLLLLPDSMLPEVVAIDEPELGLHPHAAAVVASLIRAASHRRQILVATQSPSFLDEFEASAVIVAENDGKRSSFQRLDEQGLQEWLDQYSLGELWQKNVLGGGPL